MSIKMTLKKIVGLAAFTIISTSALPAYAISSVAECNAAIQEVSVRLLKTNVNSAQLAQIDDAINQATTDCSNDNFSGAEGKLNTANQLIDEAEQNN